MIDAAPDSIADGAARLKRWLFEDALPLWASEGVDADGVFEETIGLDGHAVTAPRRARVQARQVYVFATAGRLGWDGPWRERMEKGLDAFLTRHLRPDGLIRTKVAQDGTPADETATLYDQAFALFALAAVAEAAPERRDEMTECAVALLDAVERRFRVAGGFREEDQARPRQSNPHMHLLEACLAWAELDGGERWDEMADEIARLAMTRFIDAETGALREFFAADWTPAPGADGRIVEPGHQFEWAWLLDRWGRRRRQDGVHKAALRLYEIAVRHGIDAERGVAFNALDNMLRPLDFGARLWPQTERIKAALRLASSARRAEEVGAAVAGLERYFEGVQPGLWRDKLGADSRFIEEPAPASSFYHIVCAICELAASA